jgi:hypothetical protein
VNIEKLCNIKTFKNFEPVFHRPPNTHDYIYSLPGSTPIHSSCENTEDQHILPEFLSGNGILQIPHSCNVIGPDFI